MKTLRLDYHSSKELFSPDALPWFLVTNKVVAEVCEGLAEVEKPNYVDIEEFWADAWRNEFGSLPAGYEGGVAEAESVPLKRDSSIVWKRVLRREARQCLRIAAWGSSGMFW